MIQVCKLKISLLFHAELKNTPNKDDGCLSTPWAIKIWHFTFVYIFSNY